MLSSGSSSVQAFILVAAVICGLMVYMAIDLRKKLNLVDNVLENINAAAEKAVTKEDLLLLRTQRQPAIFVKPEPMETKDAEDNKNEEEKKEETEEEEEENEISMATADDAEPIVIVQPKAKRIRKTA